MNKLITNNYEREFKILKQHLNKAYSIYSNFSVAALVVDDEKDFLGFNIENASFPAGICAERVAIFNFVNSINWNLKKITKINKIFIISNLDSFITPCGMCLQVMAEFFLDNSIIISLNKNGDFKEFKFSELNPYPIRTNNLFQK